MNADETMYGTIKITLKLGNDGYSDFGHVADSLQTLAEKICAGDEPAGVCDINGNPVGRVEYDLRPIDL